MSNRSDEKLLENYKDYYRDDVSAWRRIGALAKADNIACLCDQVPHESVLEIGAGEGSILQRLSELGFGKALHALEISESGLDLIRNRGIANLVDCRLFDGYEIPYPDNTFDLAILSHVVEHVEHPRRLLYEAARVARSVFIEVPLEHTIRLQRDFVVTRTGHINYYTPRTIRLLIQSCGMTVLGQITTNPPKDSYRFQKGLRGVFNFHVKDLLLKLLPGVATSLFTYHGALVCRPGDPTGGTSTVTGG